MKQLIVQKMCFSLIRLLPHLANPGLEKKKQEERQLLYSACIAAKTSFSNTENWIFFFLQMESCVEFIEQEIFRCNCVLDILQSNDTQVNKI